MKVKLNESHDRMSLIVTDAANNTIRFNASRYRESISFKRPAATCPADLQRPDFRVILRDASRKYAKALKGASVGATLRHFASVARASSDVQTFVAAL